MEWLMGGTGFLLFFLYDYNRVYGKNKWMSRFFLLGCAGQIGAGGVLLWAAWRMPRTGWLLWLLAASVFLAALIYTLFFALPFDSTYCKEADGHKVCRSGIYGRCRHPGIWWFMGCFVCLGMACADGRRVAAGIVLSLLNLTYAWYQDRWIFPREFDDYDDYQREVPFLLPERQKKDGEYR